MKHCNIPESWNGGDALAVVTFLDRIIQAVWRAHGAGMARCLEAHHTLRDRPPPGWFELSEPPHLPYEPIPFPGPKL